MSERSISPAELEIMRVLWAAGEPLSISEIRASLSQSGWEASTIKTLVARLVKKGDIVGAVVYTLDGNEIGRTDIVAAEDVDEASFLDYLKDAAEQLFV